MAKLGKRTRLKILYPAKGLRVRLPFSVQIFFSLTISKIVIMFISKKTMRKKDFACLKAEKPNYKAFRAPKENARPQVSDAFQNSSWLVSQHDARQKACDRRNLCSCSSGMARRVSFQIRNWLVSHLLSL